MRSLLAAPASLLNRTSRRVASAGTVLINTSALTADRDLPAALALLTLPPGKAMLVVLVRYR